MHMCVCIHICVYICICVYVCVCILFFFFFKKLGLERRAGVLSGRREEKSQVGGVIRVWHVMSSAPLSSHETSVKSTLLT